ncbi:MAG: M23 family metallopeptidase [Candidatus Krumholzibacteriota bacterium]|nr:M23 family metallopeptidase [Candidatus Krumholzibacteriota bacterium]
MDRYFTFLYVRRGNAGVKSIRIHRILTLGVLTVIISLLVVSISMVAHYWKIEVDSRALTELERENENLTDRIKAFQVEIDDLRQKMSVNFELQNRARLMANLDPISEDVWQVGVGGPEPVLMERELSATDLLFSDFEGDLDRIVRQSALQKKSYAEIIDILERENDIRNSTPSIRPLKGGFISSRFGRRMDPFTGRIARHNGVDYFARIGTPVMSTADGMVTLAKKNGNMGMTIEINHGNGFKTKYGHLLKILVKRGQRIKRGEIIGLVGNSGRSTGPHLHYEVVFRKTPRNPLNYIIPEGVYYD